MNIADHNADSLPTFNRKKPTDSKPHETCNAWKKELKTLMTDFLLPAAVIDSIIMKAEQKAKPGETCKEVYNRGWQLFRQYITA